MSPCRALLVVASLLGGARCRRETPLAAEQPTEKPKVGCGMCLALQESIGRTIFNNISKHEARQVPGTAEDIAIEVGHLIFYMCESPTWRNQRYATWMDEECKKSVPWHADFFTKYWMEKTIDEYKDASIILRMKRAICPNLAVSDCTIEQLPSDYEPMRPDECSVCKAMVADLYGIVRFSKERPSEDQRKFGRRAENRKTLSRDDNYFRLINLMSPAVCLELASRHVIRTEERGTAQEMCEELWDEHETAFNAMALTRTAAYAKTLCSEGLDYCEDDLTDAELYAHDPNGVGRSERAMRMRKTEL